MNFYESLNWEKMLREYENSSERQFDIQKYHRILSPEMPDFLEEYVQTPAMQRLKGIGLLCGTDWTPLYQNRFYYSRLDHSIGVALIVYHFTKDKKQTLAGLFHDISTPIFSHVSEFRKGDALTQTENENETENVIRSSKEICRLLKRDGIKIEEVSDYHLYSIADNERPQLSADRLEYMFPSGAALQGSWTLDEIQSVYEKIAVLKNERNEDELGFVSENEAEIYFEKFLETGHILQLNENKLTLELLGKITNLAIKLKIVSEGDCMKISESEAFNRFEKAMINLKQNHDSEKKCPDDFKTFCSYLRTFRSMTKIEHTQTPLANHFCVNLEVKQRYINPLVKTKNGETKRLTEISEKCASRMKDFLNYHDTKFGCVKLENV